MLEDLLPILISWGWSVLTGRHLRVRGFCHPFAHVLADKNHVSKAQKFGADETYAYVWSNYNIWLASKHWWPVKGEENSSPSRKGLGEHYAIQVVGLYLDVFNFSTYSRASNGSSMRKPVAKVMYLYLISPSGWLPQQFLLGFRQTRRREANFNEVSLERPLNWEASQCFTS
jgi:hypothetical protein